MADTSIYRCLNIKVERYDPIVERWKRTIHKEYPKLSFTKWITDMAEASLVKDQFMRKAFPDLKAISTGENFVIENTKTRELVKVILTSNGLDCTAKENRENYLLFACLHPQFPV